MVPSSLQNSNRPCKGHEGEKGIGAWGADVQRRQHTTLVAMGGDTWCAHFFLSFDAFFREGKLAAKLVATPSLPSQRVGVWLVSMLPAVLLAFTRARGWDL